jgi:hypothetical protein
MKLKLVNIISIFIVIIVIGTILTPWSKKNIENFYNITVVSNSEDATKDLGQYILDVNEIANDYSGRIRALDEKIKSDGPINVDEYHSLINNISTDLNNNFNIKKNIGNYLVNDQLKKNKIDNLYNEISELENKVSNIPLPTTNNTFKSIKSNKYGVILSIKELSSNNDTVTMMIFLNNGCLTYDNNQPINSKYTTKNCELQNPNQRFIFTKMKNNLGVISPVNFPNMYLKIDNIGVSFTDFVNHYLPTPSPTTQPTTPPISSLNPYDVFPDDLIWNFLNYQSNGCNKMEIEKIELKK